MMMRIWSLSRPTAKHLQSLIELTYLQRLFIVMRDGPPAVNDGNKSLA